MCKISLIGATRGGFAGRQYYYQLNISYTKTGLVLTVVDAGRKKQIEIPDQLYQSIMKYIVPRLKSIPTSRNGYSSAYKGLELAVDCNGFSWSNVGPSGCVRKGQLFQPTDAQQKTYTEVITYLKTIGRYVNFDLSSGIPILRSDF